MTSVERRPRRHRRKTHAQFIIELARGKARLFSAFNKKCSIRTHSVTRDRWNTKPKCGKSQRKIWEKKPRVYDDVIRCQFMAGTRDKKMNLLVGCSAPAGVCLSQLPPRVLLSAGVEKKEREQARHRGVFWLENNELLCGYEVRPARRNSSAPGKFVIQMSRRGGEGKGKFNNKWLKIALKSCSFARLVVAVLCLHNLKVFHFHCWLSSRRGGEDELLIAG